MLSRFLPFDLGDRVGVLITLLLISLVVQNDLQALYRRSQTEEDFNGFFLLFLIVWGLFNALGNMYKAVTVDTTIDSLDNLPTILLPEWRYCSFCEQNAPPRCFHCFTCNRCVLKRHNHCMFLGKCAGYKNFRYYLCFLVYILWGIVVSNMINADYYYDVFVNEPSLVKIFTCIMPLFAVFLGLIHPLDFFRIFTNSVTLILLPIMVLYTLMNFNMGLGGQTWHERAKGVKVYDHGFWNNLRECFGSNLFSSLLNPFAGLSLEGDGSRFKKNAYSVQSEQKSGGTFAGNLHRSMSPEDIHLAHRNRTDRAYI